MAYYGMEHRGHLYLPGCVPQTPQSLGSGCFRGGDGSALEGSSGSTGGSAARGAVVGSGETAPRVADGRRGLSRDGMVSLSLLSLRPGFIARSLYSGDVCPVHDGSARILPEYFSGFWSEMIRGRLWRGTRSVPIKCEIGRFGWSRAGNAATTEPVSAIRPEKSLVALLQVIVIR